MRGARQGDLIAFPGGHADVMEVLRARGIPASYRTSYPVWEASARVVWVPDMRRATLPRGGEGGTLHARLEVLAVEDPTAFLLGRVLEEHHEDCAAARDPGGR